jgi:hypothetical protein
MLDSQHNPSASTPDVKASISTDTIMPDPLNADTDGSNTTTDLREDLDRDVAVVKSKPDVSIQDLIDLQNEMNQSTMRFERMLEDVKRTLYNTDRRLDIHKRQAEAESSKLRKQLGLLAYRTNNTERRLTNMAGIGYIIRAAQLARLLRKKRSPGSTSQQAEQQH